MKNILCVGELLIDFMAQTPNVDLAHQSCFYKKAGGAPANVACVIGALGGSSYIFSSVGQDPFGDYLRDTMQHFNVNVDALVRVACPTTMAFVSIFDNGERDFIFNRGADAQLELAHLPKNLPHLCDIYHFGAATAFLEGKLQKTYKDLLEQGLSYDKFISFDPNYRSAFWENDQATFVAHARDYVSKAHLVKLSEEEAKLITGAEALSDIKNALITDFDATFMITLGAKGAAVFCKEWQLHVSSKPVQVVDTTGAGDAFIGAVLHALSAYEGLKEAVKDQQIMLGVVEKGTIIASKVCSEIGALTALEGGANESL